MDPQDLALRNVTYALLVELGRAPSQAEVADRLGSTADAVRSGWARLDELHAVVVDPETGGLRMLNPFSAVPTPHRVRAAGRWWHGNCAWDAFGICAALATDGRIETTCHDCGEAITIAVRDGKPDDESLLFHCLVPAAHWWDDIVFT